MSTFCSYVIFLKEGAEVNLTDPGFTREDGRITVSHECSASIEGDGISLDVLVKHGVKMVYESVCKIPFSAVSKVVDSLGQQIWPDPRNDGAHDAA